jgi:hypothetical protein
VTKYQATPGALMIGGYIIGAVEALGIYRSTGYQILSEYGLSEPKPDQMYSMTIFCDFFDAISTKIGPSTLLVMGKTVGTSFELPPEVDSIDKLFNSLETGYKLASKNLRPDEGWNIKMMSGRSAEVTFVGAFPDNFMRGLLEGMANRILKNGKFLAKIDETRPSIDKGGKSVTFQCVW